MSHPDSSEQKHRDTRERHFLPRRFPHLPPLKPGTRILLLVLGGALIILGLLGLFLPVLQGILFLILGAAALSLVSHKVLHALRYLFRPCPRAWRALLRMRRRVHNWLHPRKDP